MLTMVPLPNIFTAEKRAETPRERLNGWILIFEEIDSIFLLPFFASFQHRAITQKADPKTIERESWQVEKTVCFCGWTIFWFFCRLSQHELKGLWKQLCRIVFASIKIAGEHNFCCNSIHSIWSKGEASHGTQIHTINVKHFQWRKINFEGSQKN